MDIQPTSDDLPIICTVPTKEEIQKAVIQLNKKPTNWLGQAKRRATKIRPKASDTAFMAVFSNFDNCRPEVADDVTSGVVAE